MKLVNLPSRTVRERHGRADHHGYDSGSVKTASGLTIDRMPEAMRCRDPASRVIEYQQKCVGARGCAREVRRRMRGDAVRVDVADVLTGDRSVWSWQCQLSHIDVENY